MRITTFIGDDYADVTLRAADQDGVGIECNDEASAIALANGIADLLRRYAVEQVAVSTARETLAYSRSAAHFVESSADDPPATAVFKRAQLA
jgi:hypothetical protein